MDRTYFGDDILRLFYIKVYSPENNGAIGVPFGSIVGRSWRCATGRTQAADGRFTPYVKRSCIVSAKRETCRMMPGHWANARTKYMSRYTTAICNNNTHTLSYMQYHHIRMCVYIRVELFSCFVGKGYFNSIC